MELPFTVVFEAPSQAELRDVLRMRRTWVAGLILALAIGAAAAALVNVSRASAEPRSSATTADVQAPPAWRSQASLRRLRPALPGAALIDARLLEDGHVGLSMAMPAGRLLQAWRLEPRSGALEPALADVAGARIGFSADGRHLAYVGPDVGPLAGGRDAPDRVVWLVSAGAAAPGGGWRAPLEPAERLLDASWSPHAEHLLAVSGQALAGGGLVSRLWLLAADGGRARLLLSLPSEVVTGSELWSPDARHVAFLAHSGQLSALCLLGVDGRFRYLADLESGWSAPLAYPPLAWSADSQRVLFVAPHQVPPGAPSSWLQPDAPRTLFVADVAEPTPRALGDTSVELAAWRNDGQLLGIGRAAADAPLSLRLLRSAADQQPLVELPLKPPGAYAVAWDLGRARLLLMAPSETGGTAFWLASFGTEHDA